MASLLLLTVSADTHASLVRTVFASTMKKLLLTFSTCKVVIKIHFSETFQTVCSYTELESGCDKSSQPGGHLKEWNSHGFPTLAAGAEELPS